MSRACCRTDTDSRCRAELARSQRRGTHLDCGTFEQKVSERALTRAAAEATEETANVEVQQLENQESAANEIESHENVHSAALQEIEETEEFWTRQRLQLSKTRARARQSMAFIWS